MASERSEVADMSTGNLNVKPTMPTDVLELRAAEQRRRLHNSVVDLRDELKNRLDVKNAAREHLSAAASVAGVLGLLFGYAVASVFV